MSTPPSEEPGAAGRGGADAEPPPDAGEEPATRRELRRLRLWTAVASAWAVAASAIGLIALLTGDRDVASAADVTELSERVEELEGQVRSASDAEEARDAELRRLTGRLDELERSVSDLRSASREPPEAVRSLSSRLDDLEARVEDLETGTDGDGGGGGGGAGGGGTGG